MDAVGLRILIVCDKNNKLLGLVTDGDIRRAIIKKINFELPIKTIMTKKPIVGKSTDDHDDIQYIMKSNKIIHLPVVKNNKIINFISVNEEREKKIYSNPVLILAGGHGKRLLPLTKKIPKPLLKIRGKSVIEHILKKVIDAGFKNIFISTFYKADLIQKKIKQKKYKVHIIKEKIPLGTAGSIGLIPKKFLSEPLIVLNADLITDVNIQNLLYFHNNYRNDATVVAKKYEMSSPYAELTVRNNKIMNLEEKPKYSSLINTGIYVLNGKFINKITGKRKVDMTDIIKINLNKKYKIGYYPIYEKWIDIGSINDLKRARKR